MSYREGTGMCLGGMSLHSDSCVKIGEDAVILTFSPHSQYLR